jgi:hypothetical protein
MKTRDDFIAAASEAYNGYEKVMFSTAQQMFGIADPSVTAINEFEAQVPFATQITDGYLLFSAKAVSDILTTGWEVYVDAGEGQENLINGMLDEDNRWTGWMDEPANLPSKVRLGEHVMDAEWQVLLRYINRSDVRTIAGVKLYCFETPGSRAIFDSLVGDIGKLLGTPLAPYQPGLSSSAIPSGLLWTGDTVRVRLAVTDSTGDEDEGIDPYRTYNITISRHPANNGPFHLGCEAEQLLR